MLAPFLIAAGLVLLLGGAELLVRGAARLAALAGVSPLVAGLTVVAFGTSAPELAVSVQSAWSGRTEVAVGNVVGSNTFNVLFILGLSATISPLVVSVPLVRRDVPLMIGASTLVYALAADGVLGRLDGLLLIGAITAYTAWLIRSAQQAGNDQLSVAAVGESQITALGAGGLVVAGLLLLVAGSQWMVEGAVTIAQRLGVSDLVIGLTIIAAGTSLPEVVTSVVASLRGQRDIAVGNVVGSNLFNLLAVLGAAAVAAPGGLPITGAMLRFDLPVMLAVALACLPIFFTSMAISRGEGVLLLSYYAAYTAYLVLAATQHEAAVALRHAMLGFVMPITGATLAVLATAAARRRQPPKD